MYRRQRRGKRRPRKLPTIPDFGDLDKILRATTRERDRLMLLLARFMGLRVSEIVKLCVEHLDFSRKFLMVREGKGKKDRCLPLAAWLVGPLRGWVGSRKSGPVFPSPRGGRLTTRAVQYLVKRLAVKAGVPGAAQARLFRPHALRHAFCSTLLANGVPVHEARDLMGHSSISTTDRYAHSTPEHLRAAVERAK